MEEIWKDIKGFEDKYQVSNLGRIKSLKDKNGKYREKILKQCITQKGYLSIYLSLESKKYTYTIHRLVAQTFIPNTENKPQVNHIDGNKTNNRVDNLEWVTNQENSNHAWKYGLKVGCKGEKNPLYGTHLKEETKIKISNTLKGKIVGYKHPMYGKTYSDSPNAIKIICLNNLKIFGSIKEASEYAGLKRAANISACCKGKRNYCGKHPITGEKLQWMYYEDYLKQIEKEKK